MSSLMLDADMEHLREGASITDSGYWYYDGKQIHSIIHPSEKPLVTDHKNRKKGDNRRCNLRTVSIAANTLNCISKTGRYPGIARRGHRTPNDFRISTCDGDVIVTGVVEAILFRKKYELEKYGICWVDYEDNLTEFWRIALQTANLLFYIGNSVELRR